MKREDTGSNQVVGNVNLVRTIFITPKGAHLLFTSDWVRLLNVIMLLWEGCQSSAQRACYLPSLSRCPFIHLGREERVKSKVPCSRTQHVGLHGVETHILGIMSPELYPWATHASKLSAGIFCYDGLHMFQGRLWVKSQCWILKCNNRNCENKNGYYISFRNADFFVAYCHILILIVSYSMKDKIFFPTWDGHYNTIIYTNSYVT